MDDGLRALVPILGTVFMAVLYLFVCSTFLLASFVDPGIYPRGTIVCSVCMFICVCVCVCVCVHACIYVCACVYIYVCMCAYTCVYAVYMYSLISSSSHTCKHLCNLLLKSPYILIFFPQLSEHLNCHYKLQQIYTCTILNTSKETI